MKPFPQYTHNRRAVAVISVLIAGILAVVVAGAAYVASELESLSLAWWVVVAGGATGLGVFALLLPLGIPGYGSPTRNLWVYRVQMTVAGIVPLLFSLPVLSTDDWPMATVGTISFGVLYLARRTDWESVRRHVERVQSAEDPDDVWWLPPEALTTVQHTLFGPCLLAVWGILATLALPVAVDLVLGAGFLIAAAGVFQSSPVTKSPAEVSGRLRAAVLGLGTGYLAAGVVYALVRSPSLVAAWLVAFGLVVLGGARFVVDWDHLKTNVAALQADGPVSWLRIGDVTGDGA